MKDVHLSTKPVDNFVHKLREVVCWPRFYYRFIKLAKKQSPFFSH